VSGGRFALVHARLIERIFVATFAAMKAAAVACSFVLFSLAIASCETANLPPATKGAPLSFGTLPTGDDVLEYQLNNRNGMRVSILNYGGIVQSIWVPDRNGEIGDVVLGFDELEAYLAKSQYFGCITGRYANRIAKGKFTLDGTSYSLAANNAPNHLHGGDKGFDKRVWNAEFASNDYGNAVVLTDTSPDGDQGYPGALTTKVTYTLTEENELRIDYQATTTKPTVLNLTNHSYFNLAGAGKGTILDHVLKINADRFNPTDATNIPTGELRPVVGTPFDFRQPTPIGQRIEEADEQLTVGKGYDHNYVFKDSRDGILENKIVRVVDPKSGRVLEVSTTEPGVQLYTGNYLDGMEGKYGLHYVKRGAFCLEAQTFPDSPNQQSFPSPVLRPGETYRQTTIYHFSVEK
jgi:aldose 1-epimerase